MNDVRTKMRTYNFVSGQQASPSCPTFSLCGLRAYTGRAIADQRVQHPSPAHIFCAGQPTWPALNCHP